MPDIQKTKLDTQKYQYWPIPFSTYFFIKFSLLFL